MVNITIDKACCKGCNICLAICPKKIFTRSRNRNDYGTAMPGVKNPESCVVCRMCERECPDGAIDVEETVKAEKAEGAEQDEDQH